MRTAIISENFELPITAMVENIVVFKFQNRIHIIPWPKDKTWVETIYEYLMKKDSKKIDVVYNTDHYDPITKDWIKPEHRAKGDLPFGSANDE